MNDICPRSRTANQGLQAAEKDGQRRGESAGKEGPRAGERDVGIGGTRGGVGAEQTHGCPRGVLRPRRMPYASCRRAQHLSPCVGLGLGPDRVRPPALRPARLALGRVAPGGPRGQGAGGPGAHADALLSDN